jgi:superfamily II DNA/RNA helicase
MNFNFHESLIKSLNDIKIQKLTAIQEIGIPPILEGKNAVILAETGSGKTFTFLIPSIQKIIGMPKKDILLLIITPTKELCQQTYKSIKLLTRYNGLLTQIIIGGENFNEQVREINKGQQILISTPGRLVEHLKKGTINLFKVETVILDEADLMMDMGYRPQIESIFVHLNNIKQTLLFSATMSEEANELVQDFIKDPTLVTLNENSPKKAILELFCPIDNKSKIPFLKFLIKKENIKAAIIFSNTKEGAKIIFNELNKSKYKSALIEGDMSTIERKRSVEKIKRKDIQFLVATDVASRGIDIPHISHVINFEVPLNRDSYIHRIGRTARNDKTGCALTLIPNNMSEESINKFSENFKIKNYKEFTL